MLQKPAKTQVKIHDIIMTRWSPKAFDPSQPVARDDLLAMLEAARWAPSSYNDQPWRFIVCDKNTNERAWENALATLVDKNRRWAKNAPLLILSVAMDNFVHNGQPNRCAIYDTGAASMSLCLQATALGLVVHQMGGFDAKLARTCFQLPDDCKPMAMMAIGHQAELGILDEEFQESEAAERVRQPLSERFFAGHWQQGIT